MAEFAGRSDATFLASLVMQILNRARPVLPGEFPPPLPPVWGAEPTLPTLPRADLAGRLARLYEAPATVPTAAEISAFKIWIDAEFWRLPVPVQFHYEEIDLALANTIYENTGILAISVLNNSHPFLTFRENARFRAIHEWHHISHKIDSTLPGEIQTYKIARNSAPRAIWWLLHSEIILQAAACIHSGEFQPQKFVNSIGAAK
jgi:hypothetical protein